MTSSNISHGKMGGLIGIFLGVLVVAAFLACGAEDAHALFSHQATGMVSHAVKPFPVELTVEPSGAEVRSTLVDRSELAVNVVYSDGSVRALSEDEYELASTEIPQGTAGTFNDEAVYREAGHEVVGSFSLDVNGAYGAQYGDVLVFGRGLPAATYEERSLVNVTWGIEEAECVPLWDKGALTEVVDIATVKPRSIEDWFNFASSLQNVTLDQMDASALTGMYNIFRDDSALKTIDLTGWDVSHVMTLHACFMGCTALTAIEGIADLDTSCVQNMSYAFASCSALPSIALADWDTSDVTNMSYMFHSCSALTDLDVSSWDTSNVTTMNRMFYKTGLKTLDVSRWDVGRLEDGELLFYMSHSLTSVGDLSAWNTSSLKKIGGAFAFLYYLQNVGDIGKWNVSNVTNIDHLFQYCHALTYCGDLSRWNTSKCTDFTNMFQYCSNLASIGNISGWNTANVTRMFQTFQFDTKLVADCSSWNVGNVSEHSNFNGNGATGVIAPRW